jgi:6-phosphogluconolactonase
MNNLENQFNWHSFETAEQISDEVFQQIKHLSAIAIEEKECFKIVLAGGTTPGEIYRKLVNLETDWNKWQIYYGDERCLPANDPQRNSIMAEDNWLSHIDIKEENIYRINTELGAEKASQDYQELLTSVLPFDLVLNGMGEDGHTASLFPEQIERLDQQNLTHVINNSPKPPPQRVSLSFKALNTTHRSFIIVTGKSKYKVIKCWQEGHKLPINQLTCLDDNIPADVFIDKQALTGTA